MGDAAYGSTAGPARPSPTRDAALVAKVPGRPDRKHFPKNDFHLDSGRGQLHRCPAGQVTHAIVPPGPGKRTDGAGRVYRLQAFQFDPSAFPSRYGRGYVHCGPRCICGPRPGCGTNGCCIHPQEGMFRNRPRALAAKRRLRRVSSATGGSVPTFHQIGPAWPIGLGIRQARYFAS